MRAKLEINNPEDIEATISLTLSLKDWRELIGQFETYREGWVAWRRSGSPLLASWAY